MPNELQEKCQRWLRSIKANPGMLGAHLSDRRLSYPWLAYPDNHIERSEPAPIADVERLRRAELEIDEVRRDNKAMREDMRGLTQALVNTRKEANLARGGGVRTQPKGKPHTDGL